MSTGAIVMMLLAMVILWGGLVLAILNLNRGKEPLDEAPRRDL